MLGAASLSVPSVSAHDPEVTDLHHLYQLLPSGFCELWVPPPIMHPNWRAWASWVFLQVNCPVLNPSIFIFLSSVVSRLYALFVSTLLLKIPVHQVFTWQQNNFLPHSPWFLSRWHLLKMLQVEPVISENCQHWLWHHFLNCKFHLQIQYGSTIYFFFPLVCIVSHICP